MSEKKLMELAENGLWRERAIKLLQRKTNACLDMIVSFVEMHWQNLMPDSENLHNFEVYESEYAEVYGY